MKQALLIIDVQPCFNPPEWQVEGIARLAPTMHSIATVERHDESVTPFWRQLGWKPASDDEPLVVTDKVFVKHGYAPPVELIHHLKDAGVERALVCGIQADTCCLAAGFMLFDAGLHPTMLKWLTVGSSLDRSAGLGAQLWRHHFGQNSVVESADDLNALSARWPERTAACGNVAPQLERPIGSRAETALATVVFKASLEQSPAAEPPTLLASSVPPIAPADRPSAPPESPAGKTP